MQDLPRGVRIVDSHGQVNELFASPRAIDYPGVDWSVPECVSRAIFLDPVCMMRSGPIPTAIEFLSVREDSDLGHAIRAGLGRARGYERGNGGLYWLSYGQIVDSCPLIFRESAAAIVAKTADLWTKPLSAFQ
jgi:hypothetical protein